MPGLVSSLVLFKSIIWPSQSPACSQSTHGKMQRENKQEARVEVKETSILWQLSRPWKHPRRKIKQTVMLRKKWWGKRSKTLLGSVGDSVAVTVLVRRKDAALGSDKPFFVCGSSRFFSGNTWKIPGSYPESARKQPGRCPEDARNNWN